MHPTSVPVAKRRSSIFFNVIILLIMTTFKTKENKSLSKGFIPLLICFVLVKLHRGKF